MRVKITQGAYGHKPNPNGSIKTINAGEFVDLPTDEAERLISLGVAEFEDYTATEAVATAIHDTLEDGESVNLSDDECIEDGEEIAPEHYNYLDKEQLMNMTVSQLRALAVEMGIDTAKIRAKADFVNAISAVPVIPGEDAPCLTAEDPVT